MKVAIVFNGILRSIQYTIDNLNEYIFDQLKSEKIEYTVYCHNFVTDEINEIRNGVKNITFNKDNITLLKTDYYIENNQDDIIKTIDINKYLKYGCGWGKINSKTRQTSLFHILSLWSRKQIATLLKTHIDSKEYNYDYILFIRSDVMFHNKINFTKLFEKINNDNDCIIPDFQHFKGYNDRMFVAKPILGLYYGFYFDYIIDMVNENNKLHSETFNKLLLNKKHANVILDKNLLFSRVRADGKIKTENFNI